MTNCTILCTPLVTIQWGLLSKTAFMTKYPEPALFMVISFTIVYVKFMTGWESFENVGTPIAFLS